MEIIQAEQLGRAGVGIAEKIGYERGVEDTLQIVGKWLDEDTTLEVKKRLLKEDCE